MQTYTCLGMTTNRKGH